MITMSATTTALAVRAESFSPAAYDRMILAINEAYAAQNFDQLLEARNQAAALKEYARRAYNHDAEMKVIEIRLFAEYRMGQLLLLAEEGGLLKVGRPSGQNGCKVQPFLESTGISKFEAYLCKHLVQEVTWNEIHYRIQAGERLTARKLLQDARIENLPKRVKPGKSIWLHFKDWQAIQDFNALTGLDIRPTTRVIWYPPGTEPEPRTVNVAAEAWADIWKE